MLRRYETADARGPNADSAENKAPGSEGFTGAARAALWSKNKDSKLVFVGGYQPPEAGTPTAVYRHENGEVLYSIVVLAGFPANKGDG